MNGLVTVDVVSRVWAAEQQKLAEMGKLHGGVRRLTPQRLLWYFPVQLKRSFIIPIPTNMTRTLNLSPMCYDGIVMYGRSRKCKGY